MKDRIIPFAKQHGYDHYRPRNWTMGNNARAVGRWKKEGREIIDIGIDPLRSRRSDAYLMEQDILEGYPNLKNAKGP